MSRSTILLTRGIVGVLFGVLLFAFPALGMIGIAWALGAYAMASGVVLIVLGMRVRMRPPMPA